MIRIKTFCLSDLDAISPMYGTSHTITKAACLQDPGSWTVLSDDDILCCGGVMWTSEGVGTAWMYTDKRLEGRRASVGRILKIARENIDLAIFRMKLRRVQATVFTSNEKAVRFAIRLGLRPEGIMKYFGPNGEDAILLAYYGEG